MSAEFLRRRVHRRHLRGEERGVRLEQRAEDLHLDVARQQVRRRAPPASARTGSRPAVRRPAASAAVDVDAARNRQQLLDDDALRHHRLELVVDE